jgi:hypothetical protein
MGKLYLPDGSYIETSEEERWQVPDLTQKELIAAQNVIKHLIQKYGGKKMSEVFQDLKRDAENIFREDFGLEVEVRLVLMPVTEDEWQTYYRWIYHGIPPIHIEIKKRIDWKEGDHEKELYEWKHLKEGKRAITKKGVEKWL